MKKHILITGMAGTGKSTISDSLVAKGYSSFDIEKHRELYVWIDRKTKEFVCEYHENTTKDPKLKKICDKDRFKQFLEKASGDVNFYCGIVANTEEIFDLFDQVILLKISDDQLKFRLANRTTNKYGKDPKELESVLSMKTSWEDTMTEKGAIIIDADKEPEEVIKQVLDITKS